MGKANMIRNRRQLNQFPKAAVVALLVIGLLVAGCSSKKASTGSTGTTTAGDTATSTVRAPKTKFVLHAGLAFGGFHRYIYKPYKAGTFQAHAPGRLKASVKAGLAGLFAYHELKLALVDAQADPTLAKLVAPITALQDRMQTAGTQAKSGNLNPQDLEATNTQVEQLRTQSGQAGAPVQDQVPQSLTSTG